MCRRESARDSERQTKRERESDSEGSRRREGKKNPTYNGDEDNDSTNPQTCTIQPVTRKSIELSKPHETEHKKNYFRKYL